MRIALGHDNLPFCCGVLDVGSFEDFNNDWIEYDPAATYTPKGLKKSGTGLFTATFINDEICKDAYEQLCKHHTLLFQSQPYKNANSKNKLFLCVFKHGKPRKERKSGGSSAWPEPFEREGETLPKL